MNVLFRCDGNLEIGAGHLVRCAALAREISARGGTAALACRAAPESFQWATAGAERIALDMLNAEREDGDSCKLGAADWEALLEVAQRWRPDWVVVDHYGADGEYFEALAHAGYRVAVLDDIGGRDLRTASLVVNPNPEAEWIDYAERRRPEQAPADTEYEIERERRIAPLRKRRRLASRSFRGGFAGLGKAGASGIEQAERFCVGPAFAPLRPEFAATRSRLTEQALRRRLERRVERVFVGFGGSRLGGLAGETANAVREWANAPQVSVAANLDAAGVAGAMSGAGLAIGTAGSTVWELCCLGVPSVVVPMADNQRAIAAALGRAGAAVVAARIGEALAAARELMSRPQKRLALGRTAWSLVDGRGAKRVVDEMERRMGREWSVKVPIRNTDFLSGTDLSGADANRG